MQCESTTHTIMLAHSGEILKIAAQDWRDAVRSTGRADACLIEFEHFLPDRGPGITVWWDPECPTGCTARTMEGARQQVMRAIEHGTAPKSAQECKQ